MQIRDVEPGAYAADTGPPAAVRRPQVSVVICAFTERRWHQLLRAVESVHAQRRPADEIVVVIDHNAALLARATAELPAVRVVHNAGQRGLSATRNVGVRETGGEIVAFLDDDAAARPEWLGALASAFDDAAVIGVGGAVVPTWAGAPPRWLPREFLWVVGAGYEGLPRERSAIRNPIGANMAFRRNAFAQAGEFDACVGRVGRTPLGCEETEFAIRAQAAIPGSVVLYVPEAIVDHDVPADRTTWRYFISRCWAEGVSKARVASRVGRARALSSEWRYVAQTLPRGWAAGLIAVARRDPFGVLRSTAIVAGLSVTAAGYLLSRRPTPRAVARSDNEHDFAPRAVRSVELARPLDRLDPGLSARGERYGDVLVLVRLHGEPLGLADIPLHNGGLSAEALADHIWASFGTSIRARAAQGLEGAGEPLGPEALLHGAVGGRRPRDGAPATARYPHVTVVVPTAGRGDQLRRCLESLQSVRYPSFDVLVVDNRPSDRSTRFIVEEKAASDNRIRYAAESLPGSSLARNRALELTQADIVAFTDDDVLVDPAWLQWLVEPMIADSAVGAVTGLVLPAELETQAQWWFEQYGGFGKGFERRIYDLNGHRADDRLLYPYWGGVFGSGNSMAFRRSSLRAVGGFDPALGAGSPARAGSDIEAFTKVILRGEQLVYEPRSVCWHEHRRDEEALRRQLFNYGVGFSAILTKWAIRHPSVLVAVIRGAPAALKAGRDNARRSSGLPERLTRLERRGYLAGPFLYLRAAVWAKRRRLSRDSESEPVP